MFPYLIAGAIGYAVAKIFESDETPKYADGGSILLAPNGKPSNLTPEQYKLVRTPAFKKWFGDWENDPANSSKVVDFNGEPLVVYHGTYEDFNIFKSQKNFFTPSKQSALWFAKVHRTSEGEPKVYEVFLNSKKLFNPFNLKENEKKSITILVENHDNKDDFYEDFDFFKNDWDMNHLSDSEFILKIIQHKNDTSYTIIESRIFQDWLMQNKYDGFMVGESDFETPNYAVFYPQQIKLADGTNTTFDGSNPDIRYAGGGKVLSYNDVLKKQQTGDYYFDFLFSNENSKFIEETIDIRKLRELNGFSDDEDEIEQTISGFNDNGMDEDYEIGRKLMNKIVNGTELNPIVVDEKYKILDGRHRLSAYSELYYYYSYDYPFDGILKIYKRISN